MNSVRTMLLILLALNIAGGTGLWYVRTMVLSAKVQEAKLQNELYAEKQRNQQLSGLKRALLSTKDDKTELEHYMYGTSDDDQIKFISAIEKMGTSTSGAVVETTVLSLAKTKPPLLRGEFTLNGTWPQLYHVLRMIEESPTRIDVTHFDARSGGGDMWSGLIKIELISLLSVK